LWFTETGGGRIGRIGTSGTVTEFSAGMPSHGYPEQITLGPDSNLWFTMPHIDEIGRITPSGVVTQFSAGITRGSEPSGIVAGPDGNVWFTEPGYAHVGRITPSGQVTEFSTGIQPYWSGPDQSPPSYITMSAGGDLWFTMAADVGEIRNPAG
jgi:streptogramin lyase